jgi:hypothetical protein
VALPFALLSLRVAWWPCAVRALAFPRLAPRVTALRFLARLRSLRGFDRTMDLASASLVACARVAPFPLRTAFVAARVSVATPIAAASALATRVAAARWGWCARARRGRRSRGR